MASWRMPRMRGGLCHIGRGDLGCCQPGLRIPCISGRCSAAESAFRPDGDLLLSWQKKAKPPAPRFGPCGVPSTPAPLRGHAAYGSLRSPTSRACVARRLRFAQPPPRRLRSASLTSRFVSFFRVVFVHVVFTNSVVVHVEYINLTGAEDRDVREASLRCCGVAKGRVRSTPCTQGRREM